MILPQGLQNSPHARIYGFLDGSRDGKPEEIPPAADFPYACGANLIRQRSTRCHLPLLRGEGRTKRRLPAPIVSFDFKENMCK